ncbi:UDP-N-acetyl-D-glucosamine dehydrogenase [Desulfallas thermosapovorans DSM 6562]|uniref:UDP-N-acetyl-D-glucosamine dehydrogenase n=1 Tax=Desulfallas thermosapovorans DSM 6562 TaxID=1121431 RepID=A0A5S4ZNE0_9FIRM|nr:UDP-N-acetyl-D-glucosamine dehydrogenase [Desulfallas thermosapovorans DSM 6562]
MQNFIQKIEDKSCVVGVIGMGYVGLPLALVFSRAGFKVIGFDNDESKVDLLNSGQSYIKHISSEEVTSARNNAFLEATADFRRLGEPDAILICLPTPLTIQREPDLTYINNAVSAISACLRSGQLIVLESTTYPGTTDEVILPVLLKSGLTVGKDFFLAYSPEREDPGNPKFKTEVIPKVVGGTTDACLQVAKTLYGKVVKVVPVSSTRTAEATKLLENIYRSVNIAMINEMKILFDKMDIDVWEVIAASSTKPFGFQPFYPVRG